MGFDPADSQKLRKRKYDVLIFFDLPKIVLHTFINAPKAMVFDLARSIDLHASSMSKHNEEAIGGVTSGLIEWNESVTWRAKHFGVTQTLTSKITAMKKSDSFTDEMVSGAFKSFNHQHVFEEKENGTLMTDIFEFEAPIGVLGKLASILFLKSYMRNLLADRNSFIKAAAEN